MLYFKIRRFCVSLFIDSGLLCISFPRWQNFEFCTALVIDTVSLQTRHKIVKSPDHWSEDAVEEPYARSCDPTRYPTTTRMRQYRANSSTVAISPMSGQGQIFEWFGLFSLDLREIESKLKWKGDKYLLRWKPLTIPMISWCSVIT